LVALTHIVENITPDAVSLAGSLTAPQRFGLAARAAPATQASAICDRGPTRGGGYVGAAFGHSRAISHLWRWRLRKAFLWHIVLRLLLHHYAACHNSFALPPPGTASAWGMRGGANALRLLPHAPFSPLNARRATSHNATASNRQPSPSRRVCCPHLTVRARGRTHARVRALTPLTTSHTTLTHRWTYANVTWYLPRLLPLPGSTPLPRIGGLPRRSSRTRGACSRRFYTCLFRHTTSRSSGRGGKGCAATCASPVEAVHSG